VQCCVVAGFTAAGRRRLRSVRGSLVVVRHPARHKQGAARACASRHFSTRNADDGIKADMCSHSRPRSTRQARRRYLVRSCLGVTALRVVFVVLVILGALSIAAMRLRWSVAPGLTLTGVLLLALAAIVGCIRTSMFLENCRCGIWWCSNECCCCCYDHAASAAVRNFAPRALAFALRRPGTLLPFHEGGELIRQAAEEPGIQVVGVRPAVWKAARLLCVQLIAAARAMADAHAAPLLTQVEVRQLLEAAVRDNDRHLLAWCMAQESAALARLAEEGVDVVAQCAASCDEEVLEWLLQHGGAVEVRRRGAGDPRHLRALEGAIASRVGDRTVKVALLLALPEVCDHPDLPSVLPVAAAHSHAINMCTFDLDEHEATWLGWWSCLPVMSQCATEMADPLAQLLSLCRDTLAAVGPDGLSLFPKASGAAIASIMAADPTWLARVPLTDRRGSTRLGRALNRHINVTRDVRDLPDWGTVTQDWAVSDLASIARARPEVLSLPCETLGNDGAGAGGGGALTDDSVWLWQVLGRLQVVRFGAGTTVEERSEALRHGGTPLVLRDMSGAVHGVPLAEDVLRVPPLLYLLCSISLLALPLAEMELFDVDWDDYQGPKQALAWLQPLLALPHSLAHRPRHTPAAPWPLNLLLALAAMTPRAQEAISPKVTNGFSRWGTLHPRRQFSAGGVLPAWLACVREGAWGRRREVMVAAVAALSPRAWGLDEVGGAGVGMGTVAAVVGP